MNTIWHMLSIGRPLNGLITLLSVLTAGLLLRDIPDLTKLSTAALGAAFICGFGNAVNDCIDHAADRINRPERPIPSGRLTVNQGYLSALLHLVLGLALALSVNLTCLMIAVLASLLLLGYSAFGKRLLFAANFWVASVSALSFIYGAAVGDTWGWNQLRFAILGALFVFLFHLGREIIKDMEDIVGDTASGVRTLPIAIGPEASKIAAIAVFGLLATTLILAYFVYGLSIWYMIFSVVLIVIPLVDIIWRLVRASELREFGRIQAMLKPLMPFGLAVLLVARYAI